MNFAKEFICKATEHEEGDPNFKYAFQRAGFRAIPEVKKSG